MSPFLLGIHASVAAGPPLLAALPVGSWFQAAVVFGGGSVGSVVRFLLMGFLTPRFGRHAWIALFLVNVTGCVAVGAIEQVIGQLGGVLGMNANASRWTFVVGFLGGYTSFSALSVLSDQLWTEGRRVTVCLQAAIPIALAIPAVDLGRAIGTAFLAVAGGGTTP